MTKTGLIKSIFAVLLILAGISFCAGSASAQPTDGSGTAPTANSTDMSTTLENCGVNSTLFTNLLKKGAEIFAGLREIIYVVAGFGIIGVAVGGFFGNLNWKWLGAIIVGLMVIATTGELLEMITGCRNLVGIQDTLTE